MSRPGTGLQRGRPLLHCTEWLEEQIARLPNPLEFGHLYDQWFDHYRAETGRYARDPRASFREAAFGCIGRIKAG